MRHILVHGVVIAGALSIVLAAQSKPALTITVIDGEDAVNVVQQRTAVAPVIEVRDRNGLPVPGATVSFTVATKNAAFANGVQQLTVVTNAAGRAAAAGFTPLTSGTVQVGVSVAHAGEIAATTITQTNVLTAAQAAVAGSGGSGAAGGGAGGAGGSGSSTGLIVGGVGAAAAAGAAVALAGGGEQPAPPAFVIVVEPLGTGIRDVTEFVFTATNAGASTRWDFGGGQSVEGSTARHVFNREGRFHVTANTGGPQGDQSASLTVEVASVSGTWTNCPGGADTCTRATITQQAATLSGLFETYDSVTNALRGRHPLSGALASPRTVVRLTEEGGCRLQLANATIDASLSRFDGTAAHQNPVPGTTCTAQGFAWGLRRVN